MILTIFCFYFIQTPPFQQWKTLEKLTLKQGYDEFLGEAIEIPEFSEELLAFDSSEVTIEGYVIPLEASGKQDYFVLSRFPYNNCFFCGNAGAETVIEVYADESFEVRDSKVKVSGTLKLNSEDPMHLYFIISEAEVQLVE